MFISHNRQSIYIILVPQARFKRKNIKSVLGDEQLQDETRAAKQDEHDRRTRIQEKQRQLLAEVNKQPLAKVGEQLIVRSVNSC